MPPALLLSAGTFAYPVAGEVAERPRWVVLATIVPVHRAEENL